MAPPWNLGLRQIRFGRKNEDRTGIISEGIPAAAAPPRSGDGLVNMQGLMRTVAEQVANGVVDAETELFCAEAGAPHDGHRLRTPKTCLGDLAPRVYKARLGGLFPPGVIGRHRRVDRALAAAVAKTCAGGTGTRKARRVAETMGPSGPRTSLSTRWTRANMGD